MLTKNFEQKPDVLRKHRDNGANIPVYSKHHCRETWISFLETGGPKVIIGTDLELKMEICKKGGNIHPNIAGFVDLEWCLPIKDRREKRLSWNKIVENCFGMSFLYVPQEADSMAYLIAGALRKVLQERHGIRYPLALDNFVSRFGLEAEAFHLIRQDLSLIFPVGTSFEPEKRIVPSFPPPLITRDLKSSEKEVVTLTDSSNEEEEFSKERSEAPAAPVKQSEGSPPSSDPLEVFVSLTTTTMSAGYKMLTYLDVFLPQKPLLRRFDLPKPVPLYKIPQSAFDQRQFKWNEKCDLQYLDNGVFKQCMLEVDFLQLFEEFLDPIMEKYSGRLVLIVLTAPHFAVFNEAFHGKSVLGRIKHHFRGWLDISSTVHTCMDPTKHSVMKATNENSSSDVLENLYFNALGRMPETDVIPSAEIMSEILDESLKIPFCQLPDKFLEPFNINMNHHTCVIVHCDTIEDKKDLFLEKHITAISFLIPVLDKECIFALQPVEKFHHLDLSCYGLFKHRDGCWYYTNPATNQTLACISMQEALAVIFTVLRTTVQEQRSKGVVFVSPSKEKGIPHIMKCCLLYTSPSPRDRQKSRMPSSA